MSEERMPGEEAMWRDEIRGMTVNGKPFDRIWQDDAGDYYDCRWYFRRDGVTLLAVCSDCGHHEPIWRPELALGEAVECKNRT